MIDDELKELLRAVPDTYDDFVIITSHCCGNDENRKIMIDFINEKGCKNVTTSEVIEFMDIFFEEDE